MKKTSFVGARSDTELLACPIFGHLISCGTIHIFILKIQVNKEYTDYRIQNFCSEGKGSLAAIPLIFLLRWSKHTKNSSILVLKMLYPFSGFSHLSNPKIIKILFNGNGYGIKLKYLQLAIDFGKHIAYFDKLVS